MTSNTTQKMKLTLLTFACKWLVMSYNSLICTHLIPQMGNVFKPQLMSRCDLHSNINHSFLMLVKGCTLKQMWDLYQFGLRETLKGSLPLCLKAIQNDCLCMFTLNWKVRIFWVMTQMWKNSSLDYLYKLCSAFVFPNSRQGKVCSSMGTQVYTPGLWSELAWGRRGCLLLSHRMAFIATCASLLDLHLIWHSIQ